MKKIYKKTILALLLIISAPFSVLAATASLTPATYDFGNVTIGSISTQVFTITYTGAAAGALTVASATVSAAPFLKVLDECTGISIPAPGGTCTITVQYSPTAVTVSTATLTVVTNATDGTTKISSLVGTGVTGPSVTADISPSTYAYGNVTVGSLSSNTFTITNTGGTINLTIASATVAAPYLKTADTCTGSALPLAGTCTIEISYVPTTAVTSIGVLTVVTNATNGSNKIVSLSGNGVTGPSTTGTLTPATYDFGNVSTGTLSSNTFTLTNTGGTVNLTIASATVSAAPFIKTADTCTGSSLALAETCTVQVSFFPTAITSSVAVLTLVTNATNGSNKVVSLTGTGVSGSVVTGTLTPATYNFGEVDIGSSDSTTYTLTNTGVSGNLTVTTVATSGAPFFINSDTCSSASLAPAGTCTVNVSFYPTSAGPFAGTLTMVTNATNGASKVVSFNGTTSSPGSIEFSSPTFEFNNDIGTAVIYVTRNGGSTGVVSIDYTTSPGTASEAADDYVDKNGTLTWADGNTDPKKISITVKKNTFEDSRYFSVILSSPTGGSTVGSNNIALIYLFDPKTTGAVTSDEDPAEVTTGGGCSASNSTSNSLWVSIFSTLIILLVIRRRRKA